MLIVFDACLARAIFRIYVVLDFPWTIVVCKKNTRLVNSTPTAVEPFDLVPTIIVVDTERTPSTLCPSHTCNAR